MAGDTDMKPHVDTYRSVLGLLKYGAVGAVVVAAFVVWLLAGAK